MMYKKIKARKSHVCCKCNKEIEKDSICYFYHQVKNGYHKNFYTCNSCMIREEYSTSDTYADETIYDFTEFVENNENRLKRNDEGMLSII